MKKIRALSRGRLPGGWLAGVFFGAALLLGATSAFAQNGRLLFVTNPQSKAQPVDREIAGRLASLGFAVTVADADAAAAKTAGMDLVVISATVPPHRIESRYRDLAVPVVTWNPDILPDLAMTGDVKNTDYGTDQHGPHLFLYVVNAPHALSAGVPNGLSIFYNDSQYRLNWGRPGLGATVIATLPGQPDKAVLFGYEKGALMDGTVSAPARRVMLFLTDSVFDQLSENGLKVFDAAIRWAAGAAPRGMAKPL